MKSKGRAQREQLKYTFGYGPMKEALFKRDGYRCFWCSVEVQFPGSCRGGRPSPTNATVDHLIPVAKGGTNEMSNLVTACHRCNQRRGHLDPLESLRKLAQNRGVTASGCLRTGP